MLKAVLDSLEGLDEATAALYSEQDDKFVLDLEGADDHPLTAGMKANQVKLRKEKDNAKKAADELKAQVADLESKLSDFDGLDVDALKELAEKLNEDDDLKLVKDGKVEELVAKHTKRVVAAKDKVIAEKDEEIKKVTAERDESDGKLRTLVVEGALQAAGIEAGVRKEAMPDAVYRGNQIFTVGDDGEPVALNGDGTSEMGPDGKPLTPLTWMESMKEQAPHWWPGDSGSGAAGAGGDTKKEPDPFDRAGGTWNVTDQAKLFKSDEAKYHRLRAAAGMPPLRVAS